MSSLPVPMKTRQIKAGLAKSGGRAVALHSDAAAPVLLEYQSPMAALIARPVPPASRRMTWAIAGCSWPHWRRWCWCRSTGMCSPRAR